MNNFFRVVTDDYAMRLLLQQSHGIDQEGDGYATIHLHDNCRRRNDRLWTSRSPIRYEKAATRPQHEMMIALKRGRLFDCHEIRIAGVDGKEFVTGGKFHQCHAVLRDRKSTRLNSSHIPLFRMP